MKYVGLLFILFGGTFASAGGGGGSRSYGCLSEYDVSLESPYTTCKVVGVVRKYLIARHLSVECETPVFVHDSGNKDVKGRAVTKNLKAPLDFKGNNAELKTAIIGYYREQYRKEYDSGNPNFADFCKGIERETIKDRENSGDGSKTSNSGQGRS